MEPFTYSVPCLFGLEGLVGEELRRLKLDGVAVENGRVRFIPDEDYIKRFDPADRRAGAFPLPGLLPGPQL